MSGTEDEIEDGLEDVVVSEAERKKPIFGFDGSRIEHLIEREKLTLYNFRNPGFLRQSDLRQLEVMHQKFVEHLSARLSTFLRMECIVKIMKFASSTFGKFADSMKKATHLTLFQVEGLRGIGILDMSLPLSLAVADRMLGGKGRQCETNRSLTEIEVALLEDVAQLILVEWTQQWPEADGRFSPSIMGHDTSGRFLQVSEHDAIHVVVQAEVVLGECVGQMQLGIPFAMVEPIVKMMALAKVKSSDVNRSRGISWRRPFNGINVPVIAEWVVKEMSLAEVLNLRPGDVLEMDKNLIASTRVRLANTTGFIGTAGVEDGRVAVQLTKKNLTE